MFEDMLNKRIKCVWKDGDNSKGVLGIIKNIDNNFIKILTEKNNYITISLQSIISVKEVPE